MRKYILLILGLVAMNLSAQEKSKCDIEVIQKEFSIRFSTDAELCNFRKLQDFVTSRKKDLELQKKIAVEKRITGKTTDLSKTKEDILHAITNYTVQDPKNHIIDFYGEFDQYRKLQIKIDSLNKKSQEALQQNDTLKSILIKKSIDSASSTLTQLFKSDKFRITINEDLAKNISPLCLKYNVPFPFKTEENTFIKDKYIISIISLHYILEQLEEEKIPDNATACESVIQSNLANIEDDLAKAESQLQLVTSSEAQNQSFKKYITTAVAILLGLILVAFFGGVLYKSSNDVKARLIGESGLQFITIFVIIIAVIIFGVMNILKGSELAAILSAIAGYILGKTAPPKSDKTLEMELEMLQLEEKKAERQREERIRLEEQEKIRKEEAARIAAEDARLAEMKRMEDEKRLADEANAHRLKEEAPSATEPSSTTNIEQDQQSGESSSID